MDLHAHGVIDLLLWRAFRYQSPFWARRGSAAESAAFAFPFSTTLSFTVYVVRCILVNVSLGMEGEFAQTGGQLRPLSTRYGAKYDPGSVADYWIHESSFSVRRYGLLGGIN